MLEYYLIGKIDFLILEKKKSAAEVHLLLVENYGEVGLNEKSCRDWF